MPKQRIGKEKEDDDEGRRTESGILRSLSRFCDCVQYVLLVLLVLSFYIIVVSFLFEAEWIVSTWDPFVTHGWMRIPHVSYF